MKRPLLLTVRDESGAEWGYTLDEDLGRTDVRDATVWANSVGDCVSASGATVWQAVQAVFAKRESLS